jgi:hypothetical protein
MGSSSGLWVWLLALVPIVLVVAAVIMLSKRR